PDVWNVMLQVLDDGRLTDNKGRVVDFKNTIIIMTSNIGSHIIQNNFESVDEDNKEEIVDRTRVELMELLKQTIRPEFLNRVDEIIMFQPLMRNDIRNIIRIQLENLRQLILKNGIELKFSDYAIDYLADNGDIEKNKTVLVDVFDGVVVFRNE
nr:AAA family ATPase [Flavihumibacter sp.]